MSEQHDGGCVPDCGACPDCGSDKYEQVMISVGLEHWFCCPTHRTRWRYGSNIFQADSFAGIDVEARERLIEELPSYREVEPLCE